MGEMEICTLSMLSMDPAVVLVAFGRGGGGGGGGVGGGERW